jgi:membrane protein implicated in regulation of membrane protease activity
VDLQVPDILLVGLILFALHRWAVLSAEWALGMFVVWIVKDIAMYAVVCSAFAPARTWAEAFTSTRRVMPSAFAPRGDVRLDGELWHAESLSPREANPVGVPVVVRPTRA